ncbi:hypothetical protein AYL99_01364 [Fonsecaea erecta]|uniref:Uncharacterized protein n=1 Tax=Fonsecaea erecta TaxID=1367422 RepID=A0A179A074_9EURO|nr:hypothetical protein AYL99_01364 [Fonsecaea erecta]OAP65392.1 hypothetical protein AYL99_01364 [Fonsecaea erecta]
MPGSGANTSISTKAYLESLRPLIAHERHGHLDDYRGAIQGSTARIRQSTANTFMQTRLATHSEAGAR